MSFISTIIKEESKRENMLHLRITCVMLLLLLLLEAREDLPVKRNEGIKHRDLPLVGRKMLLSCAKEVSTNEKNQEEGFTSNDNSKMMAENANYSKEAFLGDDASGQVSGQVSNQVSNRKTKEPKSVKSELVVGSSDRFTTKPHSLAHEGYRYSGNLEAHGHASDAVLALLNKDYHWDNGKPRLKPPINNNVLP